jgi:hypothetical protein
MVSPIRIRVPPLKKALQNAEKERALAVLLRLFFRGVSTAGSRNGHCYGGCRGVLHAFCGAGVEGEGHPDIGVTCIGETSAA